MALYILPAKECKSNPERQNEIKTHTAVPPFGDPAIISEIEDFRGPAAFAAHSQTPKNADKAHTL